MFRDAKGNTAIKSLKLTTLAVAACIASKSLAQDSGFLDSVRSVLEEQADTTEKTDITRDYLERTLEKPSLDAEIPAQEMRDEGPRISVRKFIFHRLEEYPEYGITKESIEKLAEELRSKYMKEDQMFASGYTRDNLEEIAAYLDKIGVQKDPREMGLEELRGLVSIIEQQNAMRGISYADLEEITSEITAFYRRQGLFLAQVQIPAQDVDDGVVALTIQEGLLGQVKVMDNKHYSEKRLAKPFQNQLGDLVSQEKVEEGMYLLNDLPGLNVTGYFSAGKNPGETALNLKVREEKRWKASVKADNHGSEYTGDNRIFATLDLMNPFGFGDELTIGALKSINPENSTLGQLKYSLPFFSTRTRLALSADRNEFKLTSDEKQSINRIGYNGVNESIDLKLTHKFTRSRDYNFSGNFGVADKRSVLNADIERLESDEHVRSAKGGFYIDALGKKVRMLNMVNVALLYGEHQSQVDELRGQEYSKIEIDTNSLFFIPLPFTEAQSRLIVKGKFQYSDQTLPAFEQVSLGGANAVRAFTSKEISTDQAAIISTEWYFDLPRVLNDYVQFALTTDASYGVVNNYELQTTGVDVGKPIDDDWARLSAAGMLFKFSWGDFITSQVSISTPIATESSIEDLGEDQDDVQVFADITVYFD